MFIYTVVVLPIGIYVDFILLSYYSMVDVPVVHIQIIYYNHILLLTKQNLEFINGVNNMVMLNR